MPCCSPWQEPLLQVVLLAPPPLAWLVSTSVDVAEALQAPVHIVHQEPTAQLQASTRAICLQRMGSVSPESQGSVSPETQCPILAAVI
jgi:hypothetical protein